jgi:hypothetical protein
MASEPMAWRKTLLAMALFLALTGVPAGAYGYEQWDEVRNTVPGTAEVTECTDRGCTGRFTADNGVVELEPVVVPGATADAGPVRMWLSPRETRPTRQPPRMWPTLALVLAAILLPQVFAVASSVAYERAQSRAGRKWPPSGWRGGLLNQFAVVVVLGGMLAWCSGVGTAGFAAFRTPGHVLGVECPESGCAGQFVSDDGKTRQPVDLPEPSSRDGPVRAWLEEGAIILDPPPSPTLFLLLPLGGVLLFDIAWLIDTLRGRRRAAAR